MMLFSNPSKNRPNSLYMLVCLWSTLLHSFLAISISSQIFSLSLFELFSVSSLKYSVAIFLVSLETHSFDEEKKKFAIIWFSVQFFTPNRFKGWRESFSQLWCDKLFLCAKTFSFHLIWCFVLSHFLVFLLFFPLRTAKSSSHCKSLHSFLSSQSFLFSGPFDSSFRKNYRIV